MFLEDACIEKRAHLEKPYRQQYVEANVCFDRNIRLERPVKPRDRVTLNSFCMRYSDFSIPNQLKQVEGPRVFRHSMNACRAAEFDVACASTKRTREFDHSKT